MKTEKYWLSWSPRQNALHVESETNGAAMNWRAFVANRKLDYIPIGLYPTLDAACAEAERLKPILVERDERRQFPPPPP
jgi:hypothetical protein